MARPCYVTRDRVQYTLDQADIFRSNKRIDDAIASASDDLEGQLNRYFYPTLATRYPDPWRQVRGGILWLDSNVYEMASVSTLVVDSVTWTVNTDFYLDPEDGPPYTSIRIPRTSSRSWPSDERSIVVTGNVGASERTKAAGTLSASMNTSVTTMTVSDASMVGVGDLVTLDSERVIVTDKALTTTGTTITADMTGLSSGTSVTVASGAAVHAGEYIVIDSERIFVEQVNGNTLTVKRGAQSSALAVHTSGATVYAPRVCTVERACTGTPAASHNSAITLYVNDPPSLVAEAALALALNNLEQGKSAYARTTGTGEMQQEATGRGVKQIVEDCIARHGRVRIGATS